MSSIPDVSEDDILKYRKANQGSEITQNHLIKDINSVLHKTDAVVLYKNFISSNLISHIRRVGVFILDIEKALHEAITGKTEVA